MSEETYDGRAQREDVAGLAEGADVEADANGHDTADDVGGMEGDPGQDPGLDGVGDVRGMLLLLLELLILLKLPGCRLLELTLGKRLGVVGLEGLAVGARVLLEVGGLELALHLRLLLLRAGDLLLRRLLRGRRRKRRGCRRGCVHRHGVGVAVDSLGRLFRYHDGQDTPLSARVDVENVRSGRSGWAWAAAPVVLSRGPRCGLRCGVEVAKAIVSLQPLEKTKTENKAKTTGMRRGQITSEVPFLEKKKKKGKEIEFMPPSVAMFPVRILLLIKRRPPQGCLCLGLVAGEVAAP